MNILLIGFRYDEIEDIQDYLLVEYPQLKIDFAISIRDSWYRLKISLYDLVILDATCSDTDSLVNYQEICLRSEGIPVILIANKKEIEDFSQFNGNLPKFILTKDDGYLKKLVAMLKKNEDAAAHLDLQHQFQLKEDKQRLLQYFETTINTVIDPLFIVNSSYEIIEANNAFLQVVQKTRNEVIGKACFKIVQFLFEPCNEENWTCPLKEVFRLGVPYFGTNHQLKNDGNNFQKLTIKATPIRNDLNQVEEVVITFRRERNIPANQNHALFNRSLLELMLSGLSDGLIFCNAENKILLLNQAAESILGISRAKLIDKSIFNLPLSDGTNWLMQVLGGLKADMRFYSLSYNARIDNAFIQIRFAPIFGQENHYLGGFLYLTEIEEDANIDKNESQFLISDKIFDVLHLPSSKIIAEG